MRTNIKYTNIESTPAIEAYIEKKVLVLDKFVDPKDESVLCDVELAKITKHHKEGDVFKAELNLRIAGAQLFAKSEKDDLYAAIDEVRDEMERAILGNKKRKETLLRRGASRIKNIIKGFGKKE